MMYITKESRVRRSRGHLDNTCFGRIRTFAGLGVFAAMLVLSGWLVFAGGCKKDTVAPEPRIRTTPSPKTVTELPRYSTSNYMGEAMQIIVAALNDKNPHVRTKAIEVAIDTRHTRLMPKVQRLMSDPQAPVRFLATLAVGDLRYSLAERQITTTLKDSDASVQLAAAYAMTRLGHSEYSKVYHNALANKDQHVRANAALLVGKQGDIESLKYLYWTLRQTDSSDMVVVQCADAIARLGDEEVYPKLWTRLISTYADDRLIGVRAMGQLGTSRARDALVNMLGDDVLEVRLAAAEQLGKLGERTGEPECG